MSARIRCLVANVGSRGDVEPFVLLADALGRRGHDVTLALDAGYAELASSRGAPVTQTPLGELAAGAMIDTVARAVSAATPGERSRAGYDGFIGRRLPALRARLETLAAAHDLVVIGEALAFADAGRLPWRTPTVMVWYTATPESEYRRLLPLECLHLAALPSALAPRDSTLAARIQYTGFWRAAAGLLPDEVERFVAAGDPPLFLTMGSMAGFDGAALTARFVAAARAHGFRAIVQRGWAGLAAPPSPDVLAVEQVDYAALFPRCAALFVHGGTGTMGHALLSGRPLALLPLVKDQARWAQFVARLGCSLGTIDPRRDDTAAWDAAVARARDPRIIAAAARLADHLRRDRGLDAACDAVERYARELNP